MQGIQALALPSGHQIPAFIELGQKMGNLLGIVLQIGIQGKDHIPLGKLEPALQSRRLAKVAAKLDHPDIGIRRRQFRHHVKARILAAVIDEDDLIGVGMAVGNYFRRQLPQRILFVEGWDHIGKQHTNFLTQTNILVIDMTRADASGISRLSSMGRLATSDAVAARAPVKAVMGLSLKARA